MKYAPGCYAQTEEALRTLSGKGSGESQKVVGNVKLIRNDLYHKTWNVSTGWTSLLVVSNLSYPGWKVRVNDKPANLLKPFGCLQGVIVDAGQSTVDFIYRPKSVWGGKILSLLSIALLIVACRWGFRNHNREILRKRADMKSENLSKISATS